MPIATLRAISVGQNGKAKKAKKALTMRPALKALDKALNGPRGVRRELESLAFPDGDERYLILAKSLERVLAVGKAGDAQATRDAAALEVEILEAAHREYTRRREDFQYEGEKIETEIEKWTRCGFFGALVLSPAAVRTCGAS